jgi:hypothetical protein
MVEKKMKKISLIDVKQALKDPRFRDSLPLAVKEDVAKYLENPGCSCNLPIYRKLLKDCPNELVAYYPGREPENPDEEIRHLAANNWSVINCNVQELEKRLKALPNGRKQIAICRHEDQVTVVVNELDIIY